MATQEYLNFRTCCRLCLDENPFICIDIFSSKNKLERLEDKIKHVIGIQVSAGDSVSTKLCSKCFLVIKDFDKFKYQVLINQEKLASLQSIDDASLYNESLVIKDEPLSEDEDIIYVSSERSINQHLEIKIEPFQNSTNSRDDLPPILSPNLPTSNSQFEPNLMEEEPEESQEAMDIEPEVPIQVENNLNKENGDAPPKEANISLPVNNQRDLLDFAAGLQLQSKAVHINLEPMTPTELQFISRHEHIYTQYSQLRCICHNNNYRTRKLLQRHIVAVSGAGIPVMTCNSCFTFFKQRSPFLRHIVHCRKKENSNITYALANRNERDVNKHRVYQSFHCTLCESTFRLYDLYLAHADEHVTQDIQNPCHCGKKFHDGNRFKQHILSSCVIRQMCDICFKSFESYEEFKSHCAEVHDNDPGPQFKIAPDFTLAEITFTALYVCVECNLKCRQEMFIIKHLQHTHNYNADEAKTVAADCFVGLRESTTSNSSISNNNNGYEATNGVEAPVEDDEAPDEINQNIMKMKYRGFSCKICSKPYSSRANVARHLKQTHFPTQRPQLIRCGDCDKTFNDLDSLNVHLNTEHGFSCKDCGKKCQTQGELEKHRTSHLKISLKRDPQTKTYGFNASNSSNNSLDEMPLLEAINPQEQKELKLTCKVCKKLFASGAGLASHVRKTHPDMTMKRDEMNCFPRQCKRCTCILKTPESWAMHMRSHALGQEGSSSSNSPAYSDDTDYFVCSKCLKVFANRGNLRQHMRTHGVHSGSGKKKKHSCTICKLGFNTTQEWASHKLTHLDKKHLCKYCKVSFEDVPKLQAHMAEEHAETNKQKKAGIKGNAALKNTNVFECKICGKELASAQSLHVHVGWHSRTGSKILKTEPPVLSTVNANDKEPPKIKINYSKKQQNKVQNLNKSYFCVTCKCLFPSSVSLHIHITKAHGKERCPNCNMFFRTAEVLTDHIRKKHVKPETFASLPVPVPQRKSYAYCKVCGEEFDGPQKLRTHMENSHPDHPLISKGLTCPYCRRQFAHKPALSSHIRKHLRDGDKILSSAKKTKQSTKTSQLSVPTSVVENETTAAFKFSCAICQQGFNSGSDMRTHIINAHPF